MPGEIMVSLDNIDYRREDFGYSSPCLPRRKCFKRDSIISINNNNDTDINRICNNLECMIMNDENDVRTVYSKDIDGDTQLHVAIILNGNISETMRLIKLASDPAYISSKNRLCQAPLHLAVLTNQDQVVRRLVAGGAEVESRDKDGNTALHIACRAGRFGAAQKLMEPVRHEETIENRYPFPFHKIPQNLEINNFEGLSCLHLAAAGRHYDIVELLIQKGADVNSKEVKTGRTILHKACIDGDIQLVKFLLDCTAVDINACTYDGYTPFDLARIRGHSNILLLLSCAGADSIDDMYEG